MPGRRGLFVAFEGGEGAGKSTQVQLLADALRERGWDVVCTREPGGTPTAEAIREVLLEVSEQPMAGRCEVLLFAAARADHAAAVIGPALERGAVVLCDRYIDSSLAYQGAARGFGVADVAAISSWATDGLLPHLTVLLDVDPRLGLARAKDGNRMEEESLRFHEDVRREFLDLAGRAPDRYVVVSADRPVTDIAAQIREAVDMVVTAQQVELA